VFFFAEADIGDGSCIGIRVCDTAGGLIGNDSCLGYAACRFADGDIGDGSCVGPGV
jgi:hypothetical protein